MVDYMQINALADFVEATLPPHEDWEIVDGYPNSLALATIDSIQSINLSYTAVTNVIKRYRGYRKVDANSDGSRELLTTFSGLGSTQAWIDQIGTYNRVYGSKKAAYKAEVIRQAAQLLVNHRIFNVSDFHALEKMRLEEVRRAWCALPSQSSGLSWTYFMMLLGIEGVKADRMIRSYVARALGRADVSAEDAAALVTEVAAKKNWRAIDLDHEIWLVQSGRITPLTELAFPAGNALKQLDAESPELFETICAARGLPRDQVVELRLTRDGVEAFDEQGNVVQQHLNRQNQAPNW